MRLRLVRNPFLVTASKYIKPARNRQPPAGASFEFFAGGAGAAAE
jgi:hypothetical protein